MKFEVINPDGKRVFYTEDIRCIPKAFEVEDMAKAGYKFRVDGKQSSKKKILELMKN